MQRLQVKGLDELVEIKNEITPIMKGQATKQRLQLIEAFIHAAKNADTDSEGGETLNKLIEFFRPMVIELIQSISSTNIKIRKSSEEGFEMIASMMSEHSAIP